MRPDPALHHALVTGETHTGVGNATTCVFKKNPFKEKSHLNWHNSCMVQNVKFTN